MLLVVQAIAVALGALPGLLARAQAPRQDRAGLGFALVYLLYPATEWLTLNEFHPVALACPLLLFAFWYLDEDRLLPFAVFAVLAMTTKEEVGLVVAGLGRLVRDRAAAPARRRSDRRRRARWSRRWRSPSSSRTTTPAAGSAFYGRYDAVGGSAGGIVKTAFTHPWTLVRAGVPAP